MYIYFFQVVQFNSIRFFVSKTFVIILLPYTLTVLTT